MRNLLARLFQHKPPTATREQVQHEIVMLFVTDPMARTFEGIVLDLRRQRPLADFTKDQVTQAIADLMAQGWLSSRLINRHIARGAYVVYWQTLPGHDHEEAEQPQKRIAGRWT